MLKLEPVFELNVGEVIEPIVTSGPGGPLTQPWE